MITMHQLYVLLCSSVDLCGQYNIKQDDRVNLITHPFFLFLLAGGSESEVGVWCMPDLEVWQVI